MTNTLQEMSFELDHELNSVGYLIDDIKDIEVLVSRLYEDMNKAVHRGEERLYYEENHRMVRVINNLMYYTMKELNEHYGKASEMKDGIFKFIQENEKGPIAGNDKDLK